MKLEIIPVYENLDNYVKAMEAGNADCDMLWNEYAIEPYWEKLSQWAPMDISDHKPEPVRNIGKLKEQITKLKSLNLNELRNKFDMIVNSLPNYDDDPIIIALYPVDDDNTLVKEQQNGVVGGCIFGNMVINVNPLAENYEDWIYYVFAHEYHHCVWGNYWYVIKAAATDTLIEDMLGDGQADEFAWSFNRALRPKWLTHISQKKEKEIWEKHYLPLLKSTDIDYGKYMFGNKEAGIPWCAGYFLGHRIIESFKKSYPEVTFKELIEISAEEIYERSNYRP